MNKSYNTKSQKETPSPRLVSSTTLTPSWSKPRTQSSGTAFTPATSSFSQLKKWAWLALVICNKIKAKQVRSLWSNQDHKRKNKRLYMTISQHKCSGIGSWHSWSQGRLIGILNHPLVMKLRIGKVWVLDMSQSKTWSVHLRKLKKSFKGLKTSFWSRKSSNKTTRTLT